MGTREPEVIINKEAMRRWSRAVRSQGKTIGFIPTMGYLHEGHLSLVRESRTLTDVTIVSIYVNLDQFSLIEDLSSCPSDFHSDLAKLAVIPSGVDIVFHPKNLYDYENCEKIMIGSKKNDGGNGGSVSCLENLGLGHETWVKVKRFEKGLCGNSRPVFFRGVATKKDYQQWQII